jgi:hypothetical protein
MSEAIGNAAPRPTLMRLALIFALFVGIGGGVMALLGQRPAWGVFSALALVTVLGMRKRLTQLRAGD